MIFKNDLLNLILLLLLFKIFYDYNNANSIEKFKSNSNSHNDQSYVNQYINNNPISNLYIKITDIINANPNLTADPIYQNESARLPITNEITDTNLTPKDSIKQISDISTNLSSDMIKKINNDIINKEKPIVSLKNMISYNEFNEISNISEDLDSNIHSINEYSDYLKFSEIDKQNLTLQYKNTIPFNMTNEDNYWNNEVIKFNI